MLVPFNKNTYLCTQIAEKRMLEEKALRNETVVVSNAEGKIEYIFAKEVLATY